MTALAERRVPFDDGWNTIFSALWLQEEVILGNTPKEQWDAASIVVCGWFTLIVGIEETGINNSQWATCQHILLVQNTNTGEYALRPHNPNLSGARTTIMPEAELDPDDIRNVIDDSEFMKSGQRQQGRKRFETRELIPGASTSIWTMSARGRVIARGGDPDFRIPGKGEDERVRARHGDTEHRWRPTMGEIWTQRGAISGRLIKGGNGVVEFLPDADEQEEYVPLKVTVRWWPSDYLEKSELDPNDSDIFLTPGEEEESWF